MEQPVDKIIHEIRSRWHGLDDLVPTPELVAFAFQAVKRYPRSAELWHLLGNIIEMYVIDLSMTNVRPTEWPEPPVDARKCFQEALALDPDYAEAYVDLGFWLDTFEDKFIEAEAAFRSALALDEDDPEAYEGLARVLAQQGREDEALAVLASASATVQNAPSCQDMKQEILRGIWSP